MMPGPRAIERSVVDASEDVVIDDPEAAWEDEQVPPAERPDVDDDGGGDCDGPAAEALNQYAQRKRHNANSQSEDTARSASARASALRDVSAQVRASCALQAAPASLAARPPPKAGWVKKASGSWLVGWQSRWLVLQDCQLRWYASPEGGGALGVLDFDLVVAEVERLWSVPSSDPSASSGARADRGLASWACVRPRRQGACGFLFDIFDGSSLGQSPRFRIRPAHSNRAFELACTTLEEAEAWVSAIVSHIMVADKRAQAYGPLEVFGRPRGAWWKVNRISPEKFEQLADTGDVLLFRSKGAMPKLLRAASGGRYDHVALVLKLEGGAVGLLEATGNEGVGLVTWKEFIANDWQKLYPELALRRLRCPRTPEGLLALQEWCAKVIGKPYSLTVGKLMQKGSVIGLSEDFFCSQLVAEALKVFGVIPRGHQASTQFWPSTFSAKSPPIECNEGCAFDSEDLTIDFSLGAGDAKPGASAGGTGAKRDVTVAVGWH